MLCRNQINSMSEKRRCGQRRNRLARTHTDTHQTIANIITTLHHPDLPVAKNTNSCLSFVSFRFAYVPSHSNIEFCFYHLVFFYYSTSSALDYYYLCYTLSDLYVSWIDFTSKTKRSFITQTAPLLYPGDSFPGGVRGEAVLNEFAQSVRNTCFSIDLFD
jgi:hypothetical protein